MVVHIFRVLDRTRAWLAVSPIVATLFSGGFASWRTWRRCCRGSCATFFATSSRPVLNDSPCKRVQAFEDRGFEVAWCTTTGRQCGIQAALKAYKVG